MSVSLDHSIVDYAMPKEHRFNPYTLNGGTVVAVAGDDYAVIASDTRLSEGYNIHSRQEPKTHQLTNKAVVGMCGFHGDILTLRKTIDARLKMYEHEHNHQMSTPAIAAMLSTVLYYRRFFPYYVHNIVAGLDDQGKGCVFGFDPVGSYEREQYSTGGSAGALVHPLLDNQVALKNIEGATVVPLSEEKAVSLVKDVLISAAERDILTGDGLVVVVINKQGVREEKMELRRD